MDERVLQNLITIYKSRGAPLDQVVNSEAFKSLPIDKKVQVIKSLGQQSQDSMKTFDKGTVKKLLLGLGAATLAGAYVYHTGKAVQNSMLEEAARKAAGMTHNIPVPPMSLMLGIGGFGTTGAYELSQAYNTWDHKNQLKHMNTNSDNAILKYLSERDRYAGS